MTGYLLDTSIALRAVTYPERISQHARRAIERGPVFLSVISYWEVMRKSMKGKLDIGDPRLWISVESRNYSRCTRIRLIAPQ